MYLLSRSLIIFNVILLGSDLLRYKSQEIRGSLVRYEFLLNILRLFLNYSV